MRNILITGSNRGLGLAMTRAALERGDRVVATCRNPSAAVALHELEASNQDRLTVMRLDLNDADSYRDVREQLETAGESIDILINNAGINYRSPEVAPGNSHYRIRDLSPESTLRMIEVNAVAPLAVTKALLPVVRPGPGSVIAFLSSGMGSLARKSGRDVEYGYSTSKAALNMLARVLAFELRDEDITVVTLNPGWVATDMGTPSAPLKPQDVGDALIRIVNDVGIDDTGSFIDHKGDRVPW